MLAAFFATMAVAFFRNAREATPPLAVAIVTAIVVERLVAGPWYIFAGALAGSLAGAFRR
jgi:predicted branched-subunit amino acid permease